jgi:hypothetical protein
MLPANLVEDLPSRPRAAAGYIIKALSDCLMDIGTGSDVEEPLIGLGVLDNRPSLAFDR